MSNTLATLKFVQAEKPATTTLTPAERRRAALIARIEEMVALATAQSNGSEFKPTRTRTVVNPDTKEKSKVTSPKVLRAWYWQGQGTGKYYVSIRYGTHTLQFGKNNAIEAPNLKGVIAVLNTVKQAVQAGELDSVIESATSKPATSTSKSAAKASSK